MRIRAAAVLLVSVTLGGLVTTWAAFGAVFMGARFVVLLRRARGTAWLVTGVAGSAPERSTISSFSALFSCWS